MSVRWWHGTRYLSECRCILESNAISVLWKPLGVATCFFFRRAVMPSLSLEMLARFILRCAYGSGPKPNCLREKSGRAAMSHRLVVVSLRALSRGVIRDVTLVDYSPWPRDGRQMRVCL